MNKLLSYFPGTIFLVFLLGVVFYFIAVDDPLRIENNQEGTSILPSTSVTIGDVFGGDSGGGSVIQPQPTPNSPLSDSALKQPNNANPTPTPPLVDYVKPSPPSNEPGSVTHIVSIENSAFNPKIVNINVGDTVKWVNNDADLHWPASDPHPTHTGLIGFDPLADLRPGESFLYTFEKSGVYGYHDHTQAIIGGIATLTGIVNVVENK